MDGALVVLSVMLRLVGWSVGDPLCLEIGLMSCSAFLSWEGGAETHGEELGPNLEATMLRCRTKADEDLQVPGILDSDLCSLMMPDRMSIS